jgi:hypothetical protein
MTEDDDDSGVAIAEAVAALVMIRWLARRVPMADASSANQRKILSNQRTIMGNQRKILANQGRLEANQKKILANQKRILSKIS